MGLFDKFKKNNEDETVKNAEDVVITTEPVEEVSEVGEILRILAEKFEDCTINGDSAHFADYDLTLKPVLGEVTETEINCSMQMIFIMSHQLFEEDMIESCAGLGGNRSDALNMGVESFIASVLLPVFGALKCDGDQEMSIGIDGKTCTFHLPCTRASFYVGERFLENADLWSMVRDAFPQYLGKKRAYWLKLYTAWTGSELVCEARLNGIFSHELTSMLRSNIAEPAQPCKYGALKQFILFIQKDETYEPCPFSKEQVMALTFDSIEKLATVNSQQRYEEVIGEIVDMCPVKSLGRDLSALIPEMYCQMLLNLQESENIVLVENGTNRSITLKKSQLRSYAYIEEAVFRYISLNDPDNDQRYAILGASSRFSAVNQAVTAGSKVEDLVFGDMSYVVPEGYEIW